MLQEAIPETEEADGFIDCALESAAREHRRQLAVFIKKPTYDQIDVVARSLRSLKWEVSSAIPSYGEEYEHGGRQFMVLAEETRHAIAVLSERMMRPGGDRSAHEAIARFTAEIATTIMEHCGDDAVQVPVIRESTLRSFKQGA